MSNSKRSRKAAMVLAGVAALGMAAVEQAAATSYNDIAGGAFGAAGTWSPAISNPIAADTFTIDGFAVQFDENAANTLPVGATVNLETGGTVKIRRAVGTSTPYPDFTLNGTFNLNGGQFDIAGNAIERLQGTINVAANTNTIVSAVSPGGGSLGLFFGDGTTSITGSGSLTFQGSTANRFYLDTGDSWSGSLIVPSGVLAIYGTNTRIGNLKVSSGATANVTGSARNFAGPARGR
jgi:hypothetical protein